MYIYIYIYTHITIKISMRAQIYTYHTYTGIHTWPCATLRGAAKHHSCFTSRQRGRFGAL